MVVVLQQKGTFNVIQLNNVDSISYASNIYTIVINGVSSTYNKDNYTINIIN